MKKLIKELQDYCVKNYIEADFELNGKELTFVIDNYLPEDKDNLNDIFRKYYAMKIDNGFLMDKNTNDVSYYWVLKINKSIM